MTIENQTTTSQSPETPTIVGGLQDGMVANPPAAQAAAAPAAPPAAPAAAPKKYILHGKEFDSVEAALAYAEGMTTAAASAPAPVQPGAPMAPTRKKPSELLFEDPEQALQMLEEQITQKISNHSKVQSAHEKAWSDFFDKNSDLKGCEDLVEVVRQKLAPSFKAMTLEQAGEALASETRARLAKIRGSANPGEHMPSKPATVAGASGATPPPANNTPAAPSTSTLIDDLKAFQRNKGRKIS